jgi:outer membrane protein
VADYQQAEPTLTESMKQFRQQELTELQQRIEVFAQTVQQDLQKKQQELVAPIQERMVKTIKAVGEEQGMTYVFDTVALIYISPDAIDLNPAVKAKLGIK